VYKTNEFASPEVIANEELVVKSFAVSFSTLCLLCVAPFSAVFAADLGIQVGSEQQLILSGASCTKLLEERAAICEWKKTLDPSFVIPTDAESTRCSISKNGTASLSIVTCLPEFVKDYQQKPLYEGGADCWGTAMSFHQISKKPRFVWSEEMLYWLDSPMCRKLDVGEKPLPGDVMNVFYPEYLTPDALNPQDAGKIFWKTLYPGRTTAATVSLPNYTGYNGFLHAATYLTPELAFEKASPSNLDRFHFNQADKVYGLEGVPAQCVGDQSQSPHLREYQQKPDPTIRDSACSYFSVNYRCGNFETYFAPDTLSADDQQLWNSIQALEQMQEQLFTLVVVADTHLDAATISTFTTAANAAFQSSEAELKVPGLEKKHEMLLVLQYFTAAGISKSLEQAKLIP
jgi:hypothetical protein